MREIALYSSGIGLNNKVAPHRLPFGEGGVAAFEAATDVLVDKTGEIVTRRGTSILESGDYHSMWPVSGGFYVVEDRDTDSALFLATVNADGTIALTGIRSGLTLGKKFSYAELDETLLYCNGSQNGQLIDFVSSAWPENTTRETTNNKVAVPVGNHIAVLSGRVLIAVGDELFFTEYGLPGLVDMTDNRRRFEGRIVALVAVQSGAFVSTDKAIFFLAGTNPREWQIKKCLNYPAIEWAVNPELVDPSFFGFETNQLSALFATREGPVVGLPDGSVFNLIDKNVTLPTDCGIQTGSILIVDETTIIQSGI